MNGKNKITVEVIEEPLPDGTRFRYENEGRSAARIKGANSKDKRKTYPTIKVHGYQGDAFVVVSLVTINGPPYYPHPHKLIGKNCKYGMCYKKIDESQMTCVFSDLRIQCVKRKEVTASLALREQHKVDPFGTGFSHSLDASKINFNAVRLCFQVLLPDRNGKYCIPVPPAISLPIYDTKTVSDFAIMKLSHCTAPVSGGQEVILLCGQVNKDDIQIVFQEENDKKIIWSDEGKFLPHDVHRKCAIAFITPPYEDLNIRKNVNCLIYLRRPSDNFIGKPREFTLLPLKGHMCYKRTKLEAPFHKVIQPGNLPLEKAVDTNSRPKIRAVRIGVNRKKIDMKSGIKSSAIETEEIYENGAGNQLHPSYIPRSEFKFPETVNVHGYENYVEHVPFCSYQNPVSIAGDTSTVISPYAYRQAEDVFPAYAPAIRSNNSESFDDSLLTAVHMSSVISPYAHQQAEDVFPADAPPIRSNNSESFGDSLSTTVHMSSVILPYAHRQVEDVFPAYSPTIRSNNAESFGYSQTTAVNMSSVISPYARQLDEIVIFSNSPQIQLNNAGSLRDFLEDSPPNKINNFDIASNPNDSATMSGLSIDSNTERNLLDFIDKINYGKRSDESPPFQDNLRDCTIETPTDDSLFELKNLFSDSNSSEFDTNMSRLTIDTISEYVAVSISVDSYDDKVDQRMSF